MSAAAMATPRNQTSFMPREHGATAMLLVPFFSAAILSRAWQWSELVTLAAVFCMFAAKDPLVVVARQRWVWKNRHPETDDAKTWLLGESVILAACGLALATRWPIWMLAAAALGAIGFSALAVAINVTNRQRSTLFQIASAIALTSTSLAACISATGAIQPWCWSLWGLCALQAIAGILVVHARLEARISARKSMPADSTWRRPATVAASSLLGAAVMVNQRWIAAGLILAGAGYLYDLLRQKSGISLHMPLKRVGLQALSLSIAYALLVIVGLWQ